eukprot:5487357-Heterocapsa_arctica.AAC.1
MAPGIPELSVEGEKVDCALLFYITRCGIDLEIPWDEAKGRGKSVPLKGKEVAPGPRIEGRP